MHRDLERAGETLAALPVLSEDAPLGSDWSEDAARPEFDGAPEGYVAFALEHHHGLRASWERWRAATHKVARERRLPMPELSYGVFVSRVETRVGPQRHKLSVRQRFPWPGALLAGAEAATVEARVKKRDFEARALELRAGVLRAYWELWLIREVMHIEAEQFEVWGAIAESALARVAVGDTTLAEVQAIDLERARLDDQIGGHQDHEREARARLLAAVAAPPDGAAPTRTALPTIETPQRTEVELRGLLADHPLLLRWRDQADAGALRAKQARQARGPGFSVGVDWIETGPARELGTGATVDGSGRDAVVVGVGVQIPLWQPNYAEDVKAAEADTAVARAEWAAARDRAAADLSVVWVRLEDSGRRAELHEQTLIPQAQSLLGSTLGGFASGRGELQTVLQAQKALIEIRLDGVRLHAAHAVAWAELERVLGVSVEGAPRAESGSNTDEADDHVRD